MAGCCSSNEPTCACGSKDVLLLACSGGSNVGQIANDAAKALDGYGQGSMYCAIGVGAQLPGFIKGVREKPCVAIDGCGTGCVLKTLENVSVKPAVHVVVTDLKRFASFGIFMTPGLVIDGKVAAQGKVPSKDELKKLLGGGR